MSSVPNKVMAHPLEAENPSSERWLQSLEA